LDISINQNNGLHSKLRELIDLKSSRDGKIFTIYQLAKAINMPHSILVKLIHPDPTKRVNNPRIDTLIKIIDFFKSDGFLVTVDDFLFRQHEEVDIQSQSIEHNFFETKIPTFSLDYEPKQIGFINARISENHNNLMAFISAEQINPFFKIGSIFIIDKDIKPENENLVAVKIEKHKKIIIKKLIIDGQKKSLVDLNDQSNKILLLPTLHYSILGVVIQVNAKT
jgi:hypothetical protein